MIIDISKKLKTYTSFKDVYNAEVELQDSSDINNKCWLIVKGGDINNNDGAMLLNKVMAKKIIRALNKYINS